MSVSDPDPFFAAFAPLLFETRRVPADGAALRAMLTELGERAAGVILEPLVQGAAGMVMHGPEFLREARAACDAAGIPLIADEVMTGFGRTGSLFACDQADISPDILCLAKGLTGGLTPLAATLATERLFEAFLAPDRGRAFFHGHSFTAHPIGCAVALASLELTLREDVPDKLDKIGKKIENGLRARLRMNDPDHERTGEVRRTGGIVALDMVLPEGSPGGYLADLAPKLRSEAIARGVLLRPLGPVLYAMPPACTTEAQCERIATVMAELALLDR